MRITYAPKDILQIDDAMIIHRNFEGRESRYNHEGDRNFSVIIPNQEMADELKEHGWNVRIKPPRTDEEEPFIYLPVKVKFNNYGPNIYLESGANHIKLEDDTVYQLDDIDIKCVDLDIRPYDWVVQEGTPDEKRGRTAYLQHARVVQNIDRFAAKYQDNIHQVFVEE